MKSLTWQASLSLTDEAAEDGLGYTGVVSSHTLTPASLLLTLYRECSAMLFQALDYGGVFERFSKIDPFDL